MIRRRRVSFRDLDGRRFETRGDVKVSYRSRKNYRYWVCEIAPGGSVIVESPEASWSKAHSWEQDVREQI